MKTHFTQKHGLLKGFSTILCILFSFTIFAQKQYISGRGTPNFPNVKNERSKRKFSPQLMKDNFQQSNFLDKPNNNLPLKRNGNHLVEPLDSNNIYIEFYSCSDFYSGTTSYYENTTIMFSAGIMTAYPIDSNNVFVTIDFGDGTVSTVNPNYYYYYPDSAIYDSATFVALFLHSYSSAGIYYPTCTVITFAGDTATQTYYQPITILSGSANSPSITYFYNYSDQYCWGDSAYYYYWGDSLYYYGTYFYGNFYYPSLQSFSDIFVVNINFGDGTDTTFQFSIYDQYYWYWWWGYYCPPDFYFDYTSHVYSQAGTYTVLCTITFPDGNVDTASTVAYVADHCVTVGGKVFIDNNSNCIADSNEAGVPDVWLYIPYEYDSSYYYDPCYYYYYNYAFTDSSGNYRFSFPDICPMNDTIKFDPYYNFYPIVNLPLSCPSSGYYVFNTSNPQLNYDFALGCTSGYDLQGYLWGWRFRPGFQGYLYPFYGNYQCDSISGTAKLVIDNPGFLTIDSVEPPATAIIGDTIMWNFNDISILDWWNYALVYITTDTSAQDGDTIHTKLILEPIAGDADPSNNIIEQDFIVSNSWDPNEKEVFPKGEQAQGYISHDQQLSYVIHFQNTGSDTAYNISISDTIDANLNLNTLKILSSSHYMQYSVYENVITFSFPNIMLPDSMKDEPGSQGFVSYRIKPYENLPETTTLTNTAYIYFDYNPAVVTNTTLNTITYIIDETGISENTLKSKISIYPNPAKTELFVRISEVPEKIFLYDMLGRKIYENKANALLIKINTALLPEGMYFLEIKNETNSAVYKIAVVRK